MVFHGGGPPEKEHPLTTIGACAFIILLGYGMLWISWYVIRYAIAVINATWHRPRMRGGGVFELVLGVGICIVGVGFVVGGVWWIGKAINAWRRGKMVE